MTWTYDDCEAYEAELDERVAARVYGVRRDEPCVYGHFDCATFERGPCANETMSREYALELLSARAGAERYAEGLRSPHFYAPLASGAVARRWAREEARAAARMSLRPYRAFYLGVARGQL
jgi:hypothetical protein